MYYYVQWCLYITAYLLYILYKEEIKHGNKTLGTIVIMGADHSYGYSDDSCTGIRRRNR